METKKEIVNEVMRLARGIKRCSSHEGHHFSRLDSLRLILRNRSGTSSRELAQMMDVRPPSLSEWLDKLSENGEITRDRDENDKRIVRISLTDKGIEIANRLSENINKPRTFFDGCLTSEEEATFIALCEKLSNHLSQFDKDDMGERHRNHGMHDGPHHGPRRGRGHGDKNGREDYPGREQE